MAWTGSWVSRDGERTLSVLHPAYHGEQGWQELTLLGRPLGPSCQVGSPAGPLPSGSSC